MVPNNRKVNVANGKPVLAFRLASDRAKYFKVLPVSLEASPLKPSYVF